MSKVCKGCGVELQNKDEQKIGYTPKLDAEYCKRCYRITHYDDVVISMKQGINSDAILQKVQEKDALLLWVVDLFDFEANMLQGINRHLMGKDIVMVATKRDLLPDTLSNDKLTQFLFRRLKELGITVQGIVVCSDLVKHAGDGYNTSIEEVEKAINYYRHNRDVVVMGMANAGKSTLLNALCDSQTLTTSRYPGTTLDFNEMKHADYTIFDTPGITRMDSLLAHIDDKILKQVIPLKPVKARIYQLHENQTISLGGFVRFDLIGCKEVTCVAYFSERLPIHRSKQEKADELWQKHMGELLAPSLANEPSTMKRFAVSHLQEKTDIVIHGLGWFCISGKVENVYVYIPEEGNVTFRKAMI